MDKLKELLAFFRQKNYRDTALVALEIVWEGILSFWPSPDAPVPIVERYDAAEDAVAALELMVEQHGERSDMKSISALPWGQIFNILTQLIPLLLKPRTA